MLPDSRDAIVFLGLGMLGYGLFDISPQLSLSVCGTIMIAIGLWWSE